VTHVAKNFNDMRDGDFIPIEYLEIPKAVKLLLKNKVNVLNNLAGVFYLFSGIGYV